MVLVKLDRRVMMFVGLFVFLIAVPSFIHGQSAVEAAGEKTWISELHQYWVFRLFLNLMGYATIIVPGYLIIRYIRQSTYMEKAGDGVTSFCVRLCVYGQEPEKGGLEEQSKPVVRPSIEETKAKESMLKQCLILMWCAGGLLGSYLTWGLLQERIMAFEYGKTETTPGERFQNSQFLVFMNRILAFIVAVIYVVCTRQPKHTAPLYKYSYSSFSNIMSSWFQYEALKYISFPVQVLAKASKVIPVMLMGKIVSKRTYQWHEYITALFISMGVAIFMLASDDSVRGDSKATTISGVIILLGYLTFDAFTSNWQGELFKQHHMTSMQMMAGVNLFSVIFTSVSLAEQGGFVECIAFMARQPAFVFHVILLSITSATGQLFIFYTISRFGPVTFTIIMTIRQGVAILLSCVIYHHSVNVIGVLGILLVFSAVIARIHFNQKPQKVVLPSKPTDDEPLIVVASGTKA